MKIADHLGHNRNDQCPHSTTTTYQFHENRLDEGDMKSHGKPTVTGNLAIQAGLSNVARHHNPMHSRAHKHVDQTRLINPDYSSTQLLNIYAVFHLFPFTKPPAHQDNMVLIKLT
ncbi:unnamed protein product [Pleuronectes platessa]|uniref:Uncharacterized protein n=1 Tax=Pleuronectes platessa TaxID=8262 RepID=A0A9N7ZA97_PLEPL|nr:unnamed protein product [Pleuronectes platessa]